MFSQNFFPTPEWLAKKLIEPLDLNDAYVLEPSAGKGDILDVIAERSYRTAHLYAIEIVPELRSILEGKGYTVIADDFLTYIPRIHFTHIVMNPPFDDAEDHLLRAWNTLYAGEIACIFPATNLEGKTIKERTILELIADHGSRESVGKAFQYAERPTDVEVEIVRLLKEPNGETLEWEIHNDREQPRWGRDGETQEVALQGFVTNLLASFNAAMAHYEGYNLARQKAMVYVAPFRAAGKSALEIADTKDTTQGRYNTFVAELQDEAWSAILDHPGFQNILTERARHMMQEFQQRQQRMDFNESNIRAMFEQLIAKRDDILMSAILDAFDTMTKYHKENRVYYEGWKSNECWKVSRKVVLPYYVSMFLDRFSIQYQNIESLNDIDRAMCVVAGFPYDSIQTCKAALALSFQLNGHKPSETESTFFNIRYYKKGTIHLRFLDEQLWQKFNLMAAQGRNWLPPGEPEPAPAEEQMALVPVEA